METNVGQAPLAQEEGSFDPGFDIQIAEDGLWLHFKDGVSLNLGDPEKVLERFAEKMAEGRAHPAHSSGFGTIEHLILNSPPLPNYPGHAPGRVVRGCPMCDESIESPE